MNHNRFPLLYMGSDIHKVSPYNGHQPTSATDLGFAIPALRVLGFAIPLLLLLLTACDPGRHERMQQELAALQALNQADSVLTNDSLAQALADYFDHHGTPNEQMEAHYLLGRTYADRGEAPAALAAYHDAIDRADTTAVDCNFRQLSKVYGQMGELFYWQDLLRNALQAYDMGYWNAMKSRDTLLALVYFEQKGKCYYDLGRKDSAKIAIQRVHRQYLQYGDTLSASTVAGPLIYLSVEENDFSKAAEYISLYGQHSIAAKDSLRYRELWGLFKIHTGFYHLRLHHLDSAVCNFRNGLALAQNPYNRFLAYKWLYEAYKELDMTDSIAKYAEKSVRAKDSTANTHIADQMQRVQALYNYDRFRQEADRLSIEAGEARQKITFLSFLLAAIVAVVIATIAVIVIRRHRKRARKLKLRIRYTADTLLVRTFHEELRRSARQSGQEAAIAEKIHFLEDSLSKQPKSLGAEALTESFQECDVVEMIRKYGREGRPLPDSCWISLRQAINVYAPSFMYALAGMNATLDLSDTQVCQLAIIRNMPQKAKAAVMGLEYHAAAMKRKRLFKALFGRESSAKNLEASLQKIAFGIT